MRYIQVHTLTVVKKMKSSYKDHKCFLYYTKSMFIFGVKLYVLTWTSSGIVLEPSPEWSLGELQFSHPLGWLISQNWRLPLVDNNLYCHDTVSDSSEDKQNRYEPGDIRWIWKANIYGQTFWRLRTHSHTATSAKLRLGTSWTWTFQQLEQWWRDIEHTLKKVLKMELRLLPSIVLLCDYSNVRFNSVLSADFFGLAMTAAKKCILWKWIAEDPQITLIG